ncbi:hypothetical protein HDV01_001673 [Terramyces sp. JEL0728]|nr:hypothetical protein HDV01_001673 [Terramyces sp. JEL0728]
MNYIPIRNEQTEINPAWYDYLSCSWLNPLMYLSQQGIISEKVLCLNKDLYQLAEKDKSETISKSFNLSNNLIFALFDRIKVPLVGSVVADLLSRVIEICIPLILQKLVLQLFNPTDYIYYYALGMVLLQFIEILLDTFRIMTLRRIDQIIKSILTSAIYDKSLRLSNKARLKFPEGKIMNMFNQDINSVCRGYEYFFNLIWIPLRILFSLLFLYQLLGNALFVSLVIVVFVSVVSVSAASIFKRTYALWIEAGDKRLGIIREFLYGIKVVKYSSLESYFKRKINEFRNVQIYQMKVEYFFTFGVQVIVYSSILLMVCCSVLIYSLLGNEMSADVIFPAVLYFGNLKDPLFRITINCKIIVVGLKSVQRIQEFLLADEEEEKEMIPGASIIVKNGCFVWPSLEDNQEFSLSAVNLAVEPNTLVGIVGSVGAGKSSLLAGIIGQMEQISGETKVSGRIGYCSQQPWIITGTIEQNILFHLPKRKEWLDKVVEMCGLVADLALLSNGLQTEIGENGVNLSGGQKARVSLARAIYSDADILLLDDPLSALDSKVGRHVFNSIKSLPKTILLVTHHLQYVNQMDYLIVMENGKIKESTSISDLEKSKLNQMIQEHIIAESCKDEISQLQPSDSFVEPEEKKTGVVDTKVYIDYINSLGGVVLPISFILIYLIFLVSKVTGPLWLSIWTSNAGNDSFYLKYYTLFNMVEIMAVAFFHFVCIYLSIVACKNIHDGALSGLLNAPLSFFDQNPIGRILNRMSKDVFSVDREVVFWILDSSLYLATIISSLVLICLANYYILLLFFMLGIVMYKWFTLYRYANIEFQRLLSLKNSPLDSHITETLAGMVTIKTFNQQQEFMRIQKELTDSSQVALYIKRSLTGWIIYRVKLVATAITTLVTIFALKAAFSNDNKEYISVVAMALTYSCSLPYSLLNWLVVITRLEASMNGVERLTHYANDLPEEIAAGQEVTQEWPSMGAVEIKDLDLVYVARPDFPVIKDLSLKISPGEKVGIVGRTGSGKSTLASSFFRIIEPAHGTILIDDIGKLRLIQDICSVEMKTLRKRLQMIPQEPVLFEGTIRSNLDFESEHSDEAIWKALEHAGIKNYICGLNDKLDSPVSQNGNNFSVGQRQLLCLARAILSQPKFLVMDEATSSIDLESDALVQDAIQQHFQTTTVICIAHRLNTIADFDKVLVLEKGKMVEFDTPANLLESKNSLFSQMVNASGKHNAQKIKEKAQRK